MFRASREHLGNILEGNIFLKILNVKVVFVLKVYDLTIANVNHLVNSSNHKAMFPGYLKNIPRICVPKDIPGILQSYENIFTKSKISKACFIGYPVKILILSVSHNVFLNCIETIFQLGQCFEKARIDARQLVKICGALHDLVPFVQFKKREKHP